jgi:uncharacterized protein (DUF1697 family)
MTQYVAFLRGINVGGNKKIGMERLRGAFASWGFANVKTLLASGNVLFETRKTDLRALTQTIERGINRTFGLEVSVILRTLDEIRVLAEANPFRNIKVTPRTRLFVTFLAEKPKSKLKIPYVSPDKSFKILCITDSEVCSVLALTARWGANLRQMDILEKEFGKKITTRNWNTVTKVLEA